MIQPIDQIDFSCHYAMPSEEFIRAGDKTHFFVPALKIFCFAGSSPRTVLPRAQFRWVQVLSYLTEIFKGGIYLP